MPLKTREEAAAEEKLLSTKVRHKTLRDWTKDWEPRADAFGIYYVDLPKIRGLIRIILDGKTKYIICASYVGGGIQQAIQRIRTKKAKESSVPPKIRENIGEIKVEILRVDYERDFSGTAAEKESQKNAADDKAIKITKELKRAMVELYKPEWDILFQRRMEKIRAGTIKAKRKTKKNPITRRVIQLKPPV